MQNLTKMYLTRMRNIINYLPGSQACMVSEPKDLFYLTGFSEAGVQMFLSKKGVFLSVPEMLKAQFRKNFPKIRIMDSKKLKDELKFLKKSGIKSVVANSGKISYSTAQKLNKIGYLKWIYSEKSDYLGRCRIVKDDFEIKNIKKACLITRNTFSWIRKTLKPGMSEREVARMIKQQMLLLGADGPAFEPIVAGGGNSSMPHHANGDHLIRRNSPVLLDFGCVYKGYNSDLTRTVYLGKMLKLYSKISKIVLKAYREALSGVKPGVSFAQIDHKARSVIKDSGYGGNFIHSVGHGIGLDVHEKPFVRALPRTALKAGMVITIEPGIYIEGSFGIRHENTVLVTKNGYEVLT